MINGIETEVGIFENAKEYKLGTINVFKNSNCCRSCCLTTFAN
jgi:hypothetical protein